LVLSWPDELKKKRNKKRSEKVFKK